MARINYKNFNWVGLEKATREIGPSVWESVQKFGEGIDDLVTGERSVLLHGYRVRPLGFSDRPPKIVLRADLQTKLEGKASSDRLDRVMRETAKDCSSEDIAVSVVPHPNSPQISALESDRVFGRDFEIPPTIIYEFHLAREPFQNK